MTQNIFNVVSLILYERTVLKYAVVMCECEWCE